MFMPRLCERLVPFMLAAAIVAIAAGPAHAQQPMRVQFAGSIDMSNESAEAAAEFWRGMYQRQNIFFARAGEHFQRAIRLDENFGLARVLYGIMASDLTPDERDQQIERGIMDAARGSAAELTAALAMRARNQQNWKEAEILFAAAARLSPDDPYLAYEHNWLRHRRSEPRERVQIWTDMSGRFPNHAPTYNVLAYTLWRAGDKEAALTAVRRYVELASGHPNSHDSYAELLQWSGEYEEAARHYRRAVELDPNYSEGYSGLADVMLLSGDAEAARAHWEQAIERAGSPGRKRSHRYHIASSYLFEGDVDAALEVVERIARQAEAREAGSAAALAHGRLAELASLRGDGDAVRRHLAASASHDGGDTPLQHIYTAVANLNLGNAAAAREAVRLLKVSAANTGSTAWIEASHAVAGTAMLMSGDARNAITELQKANPTDTHALVSLVIAHERLGNESEAEALRQRILAVARTNFNHAIARYRLEQL